MFLGRSANFYGAVTHCWIISVATCLSKVVIGVVSKDLVKKKGFQGLYKEDIEIKK